ncbi:hypothetical protein [Microbacterium sp. 2FI]|uniref:hypothetical protein n=1 Tax=Microbacterium sp. 2FI TaxID=2502193 RepID=UPI0010F80E2B|nr:hypothetical protein [Microbacterium sp. 2FI]
MMAQRNRRGLIWAILGALILLAGIVAIIIAAIGSTPREPETTPAPGASSSSTPTTEPTATPPDGDVVDATVEQRGWVPEPITTDAETYVRAALAAAGTFDTQLSTYEEWIAYLGTWFTPDTRYTSEADREAELAAAKLELRQSVVLPESEWDSLANEDGRMASVVSGDVTLAPVPDDPSGDMTFGTADIAITFNRSDGGDGEVTYDETTRLTVQVLCGPDSVPTPNSSQQAGDCKVIRFFSEPLEP